MSFAQSDPPSKAASPKNPAVMRDPFGRALTYLRLSLTDRCNLRCTYCLPERARFAARGHLLEIDELERVARAFVQLGVRKIRLTGGEPLVRKGAVDLIERLGTLVAQGELDELTLTTNGLLLAQHAGALARAGIRRINVSLDHLDPGRFAAITRGGDLGAVIKGIETAQAEGIAIKINAVALRSDNLEHLPELVAWAHARGMAITLIEVMPVGDIGAERLAQHVPMPEVRALLERSMRLEDVSLNTGGPARYARSDRGGLIGFITPLSANFCSGCNRVRVSADGLLHACLGHSQAQDLKPALRSASDDRALEQAIRALVAIKPLKHDFRIGRNEAPAVERSMAATGG